MYDLVVVGSGPAGSVCARKAALEGLDVAIIEKDRHPRKKLCGGAIGPRVEQELDFGIESIADRKYRSARIYGPHLSTVELTLHDGGGYIVKRPRFDSYLLKKAREAGVDVYEGSKAIACEHLRRGIRVLCEGDSFKARLLAGADGCESIVARSLGMRDSWRPDEIAVGFAANIPLKKSTIDKISYKDTNGQTGLEIYFGMINLGYGWFFPKQNEVSIGLGCRLDEAQNPKGEWKRFLQQLETRKGTKLEVKNGKGFRLPYYTRSTQLITRRTMLLGDAAGLVSPITGEGIYYAVRSGTIASQVAKEAVDMRQAAHVTTYETRIRRELEKELESQAFLARTAFKSNHRVSRMLNLLSEDKVLRSYAEQIILGSQYEGLKSKIMKRMLTRHPLDAMRFAI